MRILDVNNTEILEPNYDLGYTKSDKIFIMHHEAVAEVKEQGHYNVIRVYEETGGKDVEWVVDIPGVEAKEAWDEYEDILRYVEYTQEELDAIEAERNKPTQLDKIEAQVAYTAMLTNTLLEG